MRLFGYLKLGGCVLSAALLLPAASQSQPHSCQAGTPTAESYTWNFRAEAQGLLDDVGYEARQTREHADQLHTLMSTESDWEPQALELSQIRDAVNDMGRKLCRLEAIHRVASPWEQKAIDQAAPLIAEMANDTENAITFLNNDRNDLFMPAYTSLGTDLYRRSASLAKSIREFEKFGKVHQEDMHLEKSLGLSNRG
jgi:hypothetical protein